MVSNTYKDTGFVCYAEGEHTMGNHGCLSKRVLARSDYRIWGLVRSGRGSEEAPVAVPTAPRAGARIKMAKWG